MVHSIEVDFHMDIIGTHRSTGMAFGKCGINNFLKDYKELLYIMTYGLKLLKVC